MVHGTSTGGSSSTNGWRSVHSLGVLMPTAGHRPTLTRAAATTLDADCLCIAWDASVPPDPDVYKLHWSTYVTPVPDGPHHDAGAVAREFVMARTHLVTHWTFLDDDDALAPYAVDVERRWIADAPDAVHVGCMLGDDGETVVAWREPRIERGQIGAPCIVAPTALLGALAREGAWPVCYDWDWRLVRALADRGAPVVWHEDVVARVRPWGRV